MRSGYTLLFVNNMSYINVELWIIKKHPRTAFFTLANIMYTV